MPGAVFATPETLAEHVGPQTAAILLEPVQGEGGVHPLAPEVLQQARALADEHGALLILDEVQTGVGRTGSFFAWQQLGVRPDAVTLAKGLANGLPIGVLLVADEAPTAFEPGDHASTFGGNPVACAAACAVVDTIDDDLLADVRELSALLSAGLARFGEVRGLGLLLAVELDRPGLARRRGRARARARDRQRRRADAPADAAAHAHGRGGDGRAASPRRGARVTATKFDRQGAILRLVQQQPLSTQSEVAEALRANGIEAVQATVSRDIAQLGLVKVRNAEGRLVYAHAGRRRPAPARRARPPTCAAGPSASPAPARCS